MVLAASGHQPLEIYGSMWSFGTQLNSIISMINRAVPYYLAGLAVAATSFPGNPVRGSRGPVELKQGRTYTAP